MEVDCVNSYTPETILTSLGFADPMMAARQQARLMLLGRLVRYQVNIQQLEKHWGCSLADLQLGYEAQEEFGLDDAYLEWKWYADGISMVKEQLRVISEE